MNPNDISLFFIENLYFLEAREVTFFRLQHRMRFVTSEIVRYNALNYGLVWKINQ